MALEELEKELYTAKRDLKRDGKRRISSSDAAPAPKPPKPPETWTEESPEPDGVKWKLFKAARPLFWFLIVASIAGVGFGVFYIYQYFGSQGVSLVIDAADEIKIGVPFDVAVSFKNDSKSILKNSLLNLQVPSGIAEIGRQNQPVIAFSAGDIGAGSALSHTYRLIASSDAGEGVKRLKASLTYETETIGNNLRFEEVRERDIKAVGYGLFTDLVMPSQVVNGEEFEIEIRYRNESEGVLSDLALEAVFPANFRLASADPAPSRSNNVWQLGDLFPDVSDAVVVKGSLIGPVDAVSDFSFSFLSPFLGEVYPLNVKQASMSIAPSPFDLALTVNGKSDYVAKIGDRLSYALTYKNMSDVQMVDTVVRARLVGELFDFASLKSDSLFDSVANTLIWNGATTPELRLVNPGAGGTLSFEVSLKKDFTISRLNDKNYTLRVEAEIESPTVPVYVKSDKTSSLARFETKISGMANVDAKTYFRDASSGIVNSGPMPLKVNQASQFTVHWLIVNYTTDLSGVEVKAVLPPAVRWTNAVKSEAGTGPAFDERSREVVWRIDKIMATKGVISPPLEAVFQIELTPAINQVGQILPLLGATALTAKDDFTGTALSASDTAIDTSLPDDTTVGPGGRIVE